VWQALLANFPMNGLCSKCQSGTLAGIFSGFSLGSVFAEKIEFSCSNLINVVEMECVKFSRGTKGHYKLVKDGECIIFLVL
jgi:hypothetical protein